MSGELVVAQPADPHGLLQRDYWSEVGLSLPADLPFESWVEVGLILGRFGRSVQWCTGDWIKFGEWAYGEKYSQAIDATGLDYDTLNGYRWVSDRFDFVRRRTKLTWGHHREVAADDPAVADSLLDQAEAGGWSVMELRSARRRAKVASIPPLALPAGKYSVIVADPPWQYDFVEAPNRAIENQYPTLTADEIACYEDANGRSVADLAADDAVLYLWATNPKLEAAMTVMAGWGFRYTTNLVWVKDRIGMGYWARQRHELVLIGTRGNVPPPEENLRPDSVIEAPRTRHSAKPPAIHELIERVWPDAPKVEVFAREQRPGWAVFGNDPKVAA